jgi:hypothetical protein
MIFQVLYQICCDEFVRGHNGMKLHQTMNISPFEGCKEFCEIKVLPFISMMIRRGRWCIQSAVYHCSE